MDFSIEFQKLDASRQISKIGFFTTKLKSEFYIIKITKKTFLFFPSNFKKKNDFSRQTDLGIVLFSRVFEFPILFRAKSSKNFRFRKLHFSSYLEIWYISGFFTEKKSSKNLFKNLSRQISKYLFFPSNRLGKYFIFSILCSEKSSKTSIFFPSNRKVLNEIKIEIFVKFQKLDFSVNFENWNFLHQF